MLYQFVVGFVFPFFFSIVYLLLFYFFLKMERSAYRTPKTGMVAEGGSGPVPNGRREYCPPLADTDSDTGLAL